MQIFYLYSQSVPLETKGAFIPVSIGDVPKQGGVSHLAKFYQKRWSTQKRWSQLDSIGTPEQ